MSPDAVNAALIALQEGRFADARSHIRAHNAIHSREKQDYLIEGLASLALADWSSAREVFQAATEDFGDNAQFWFNRGLAEENLNRLADAEASYGRSLALKPEQGEIFGNLSNIHRRRGRLPEAVQTACRALAAGAPKAQALNILGLALGKQGNFGEAQKALDEAIALAPHEATIVANRANLAVDQLKFDEAWRFFAEARSLTDLPVIRRDEGMARLLAGDYAAGLPLYEARLDLPNALRLQPAGARWKGEDLSGKTLLLVSEQGFGDTIQFSRYAQRLADKGARLVWAVRQPLLRLLADHLPGAVLNETGVLPPCDYWLPILSLPLALGMTAAAPAPMMLKAPVEPQLPPARARRKIGLVWKGSATHERDHERSIPLTALAPLFAVKDTAFFAPFREADDDVKAAAAPVVTLGGKIGDFAAMAALLKQLDALITIDTAAAHLAGALGVATFLLLPHCPDWRWGTTGEKTAWYPGMVLLRQSAYGDWDSVVQALLKKL